MNIKVISVYGKERELGTWYATFASTKIAAMWLVNNAVLPPVDHVLDINGRIYNIPDLQTVGDIESHIEYCIDIDRSFYN